MLTRYITQIIKLMVCNEKKKYNYIHNTAISASIHHIISLDDSMINFRFMLCNLITLMNCLNKYYQIF